MGPEMKDNERYDQKADCFSLGILIWEMCILRIPTIDEINMKIYGNNNDININYSYIIKDIINSLVVRAPNKRS